MKIWIGIGLLLLAGLSCAPQTTTRSRWERPRFHRPGVWIYRGDDNRKIAETLLRILRSKEAEQIFQRYNLSIQEIDLRKSKRVHMVLASSGESVIYSLRPFFYEEPQKPDWIMLYAFFGAKEGTNIPVRVRRFNDKSTLPVHAYWYLDSDGDTGIALETWFFLQDTLRTEDVARFIVAGHYAFGKAMDDGNLPIRFSIAYRSGTPLSVIDEWKNLSWKKVERILEQQHDMKITHASLLIAHKVHIEHGIWSLPVEVALGTSTFGDVPYLLIMGQTSVRKDISYSKARKEVEEHEREYYSPFRRYLTLVDGEPVLRLETWIFLPDQRITEERVARGLSAYVYHVEELLDEDPLKSLRLSAEDAELAQTVENLCRVIAEASSQVCYKSSSCSSEIFGGALEQAVKMSELDPEDRRKMAPFMKKLGERVCEYVCDLPSGLSRSWVVDRAQNKCLQQFVELLED